MGYWCVLINVIEDGDIPDNWSIRGSDDESATLMSDNRKMKIEIEKLAFSQFDEKLPRIEAYKTENPYQPGMGRPMVENVVPPSESLTVALNEAISELRNS